MYSINLNIFKRFLSAGSASGIIILLCVVASLVIANSPAALPFQDLLNTPLGYQSELFQLLYPLQIWINDGLMAVFFLMVGLEIKRELVYGELSTPKKALLPILCAIGGAVTPAIIFAVVNKGLPTSGGWGIPMATDIAFVLAIIGMLNKHVPAALKVFLVALAIVDDLMAILVIAFFYAGSIHVNYLLYAAAILALLFLLNRLNVKALYLYLIPGVFLWYFVHHSGVHATIAGVLVALFIPSASTKDTSPLEKLEHLLTKPVNYLFVPLFALANTNITFQGEIISGLTTPLGLGIILGLVIGKPVGILCTAYFGTKTGLCQLPDGSGWRHLTGAGLLAGIGFTMSIFMALLSFAAPELIAEAKIAVLCASLIAAIAGYLLLKVVK